MHYHWEHSTTLIKDIEVFAPHKRQEALIHTPADADPKHLWNLACAIRKAGFAAEADNDGNKPVLRVTNFESQDELFATLRKEGAISPEKPTTTTNDRDADKGFKLSSLQIAGAMQVFADLMIMYKTHDIRGWEQGKDDIKGSAKFTAAFALLTAFGAKNPDRQTDYIYKDLKDKLQKSGYELNSADSDSLKELAAEGGVASKIERAVRDHPILINALIQTSGGINAIGAGLTQKRSDGSLNPWKTAGGVLTSSGQLIGGVLLDPKEDEPDVISHSTGEIIKGKKIEPRTGPIGWIRDRIDKTPLFLTGMLSTMSNISRVISGHQERKEAENYLGENKSFTGNTYAKDKSNLIADFNKNISNDHGVHESFAETFLDNEKTVQDRLAKIKTTKIPLADDKTFNGFTKKQDELSATYQRISNAKPAGTVDLIANSIKMASNLLIASSSSNIDADLDKTGQLDEICNFMAHVTKAQPPQMRNETLQGLSIMLASQGGIDINEKEVSKRISNKLTQLDNNPWDRPEYHEKEATPKPAAPNSPSPQLHKIASHTMQQQSPFEIQGV